MPRTICGKFHLKLIITAVLFGLCGGFLTPWSVSAASFHIIPSESSVTLSADIDGVVPATEQFPGSLTSTFTGTLEATTSPGFISFDGGSIIDVVEQPGPFLPGNQPADFAAVAENIIGDLDGYAAIKNVFIDVSNGPQAVSGAGEFSTAGMTALLVVGGTFDFTIPGLVDGSFLMGGPFDSVTPLTGTLEDLGGGVSKITLPFEVSDSSFDADLGLTLNLTATGQIVAVTPEPSTLVLFIVGAVGMIVVGCRKRQVIGT